MKQIIDRILQHPVEQLLSDGRTAHIEIGLSLGRLFTDDWGQEHLISDVRIYMRSDIGGGCDYSRLDKPHAHKSGQILVARIGNLGLIEATAQEIEAAISEIKASPEYKEAAAARERAAKLDAEHADHQRRIYRAMDGGRY